jgi:U3 small nucleolar RNA-associated protein 7
MDALFAKAGAIRPVNKRRKIDKDDQRSKKPGSSKAVADTSTDRTANSIVLNTKLPRSLQDTDTSVESLPQYKHIANKKLRAQLTRQSAQNARAKTLVKDAELLLAEEGGAIQVEGELEKTWKVSQADVVLAAGQEAARGRQEWTLDGGPYRSRYTRNGRYAPQFYFL